MKFDRRRYGWSSQKTTRCARQPRGVLPRACERNERTPNDPRLDAGRGIRQRKASGYRKRPALSTRPFWPVLACMSRYRRTGRPSGPPHLCTAAGRRKRRQIRSGCDFCNEHDNWSGHRQPHAPSHSPDQTRQNHTSPPVTPGWVVSTGKSGYAWNRWFVVLEC